MAKARLPRYFCPNVFRHAYSQPVCSAQKKPPAAVAGGGGFIFNVGGVGADLPVGFSADYVADA